MNTENKINKSSCLDLDSRYVKSYATEANLFKAMANDEIDRFRFQLVRTQKGRFTALIIGFEQELLGSGWPMIG